MVASNATNAQTVQTALADATLATNVLSLVFGAAPVAA
jgi:hypothetical protein